MAIIIRHVVFEDAGILGDVLGERTISYSYREAATERLDGAEDAELLVVLGGPISVNDVEAYPFLVEETAIIAKRLADDKPTIGICLGAQLIAKAAGAKVYPGAVKEIGFGRLRLSDEAASTALGRLSEEDYVLHWHGDTFDLPEKALRLAGNEHYPNQAFSLNRSLALQFHLETGPAGLEAWYVGHTLEIEHTPGVTVQGLREQASKLVATEGVARAVFHAWLDEVGL